MKKKILLALFTILLIANTPVFAKSHNKQDMSELNEVLLEIPTEDEIEDTSNYPQAITATETNLSTEKSLKEKLRDVYHLEVDKYDKPTYLLENILTKDNFKENSIIDHTQLWAGYNGDIGLQFIGNDVTHEHTTNHYDINTINVGYDIFLKDNKADARIMFNYNPFSNRNVVRNLFADMYIATNKIPHHRILIGHSRPPVGMEGSYGPFTLPFLARSQISRNFGTVRKLGARVMGNYSLVDYDLGVYSSDTYFKEFFPGTEFIGWVNFKPLAKTDGKYGKLKMGAGIDGGNRTDTFFVSGAYVGYEYKRFMANVEWAHASGYNGPSGHSSRDHASGFYTTLGYMLTKKLQLLARYDEFDPNRNIGHNNKREYSLGLNYFIKGQGLRLIMNYVFCDNDASKDSHRIMLGTQILL